MKFMFGDLTKMGNWDLVQLMINLLIETTKKRTNLLDLKFVALILLLSKLVVECLIL
jgi:hypothetical protein